MTELSVKSYVDIVNLKQFVDKKYGKDVTHLCAEAHIDQNHLFELERGNGSFLGMNFGEISSKCKHPQSKKMYELFDLETKHLQDGEGYVDVYYWW
jgi:hypothetical protein